MTYDLALELKNAGFPQSGKNEPYCLDCKRWKDEVCFQAGHNTDYLMVPALTELIKACEPMFGKLEIIGRDEWAATSFEGAEWGTGVVPDIAVARLWLTLNKSCPCPTLPTHLEPTSTPDLRASSLEALKEQPQDDKITICGGCEKCDYGLRGEPHLLPPNTL